MELVIDGFENSFLKIDGFNGTQLTHVMAAPTLQVMLSGRNFPSDLHTYLEVVISYFIKRPKALCLKRVIIPQGLGTKKAKEVSTSLF